MLIVGLFILSIYTLITSQFAYGVTECLQSYKNRGVYCTLETHISFFSSESAAYDACIQSSKSHDTYNRGTCGGYWTRGKTKNYKFYDDWDHNNPRKVVYPIIRPWTNDYIWYVSQYYYFTVSPSCSENTYIHRQKGCITVDQNKEAGTSNSCAGNPINIASGNKFQHEIFFSSAANPYFQLSLYYNSTLDNWQMPYFQSVTQAIESQDLMEILRSAGEKYLFTVDEVGVWKSDADVTTKLSSIVLPDSSNGEEIH